MSKENRIWTAADVKSADARTMASQGISSAELMERAATVFFHALLAQPEYTPACPVSIMAGPGNNGGDALVLARLLAETHPVRVFLPEGPGRLSPDATHHFHRLPDQVRVFSGPVSANPKAITSGGMLLDGLFGVGLNRPLSGIWADWVLAATRFEGFRVAIDVPSGLWEETSPGDVVFSAHWTGTFEAWKVPLLLPGNQQFTGSVDVLGIGLEAPDSWDDDLFCLTREVARPLFRIRERDGHKGTYGHAALLAGSKGKMGAALLAARATLKSGAGLLTVHGPAAGEGVVQTGIPEAMYHADPAEACIVTLPDLKPYRAVGAGPGLGTHPDTGMVLDALLSEIQVPLVLDADALNWLARRKVPLSGLPGGTILTPHPGEWDRLVGKPQLPYDRFLSSRAWAQKFGVWIILKGAHSLIAAPDGRGWINFSGNPGMATGGSGDVLCGMLTGLLAQGYSQEDACLLGVFLHGLSGDLATRGSAFREPGLLASDLIRFLPDAMAALED